MTAPVGFSRRMVAIAAVLAAMALGLSACGGGSGAAASTAPPSSTPASSSQTTTSAEQPINLSTVGASASRVDMSWVTSSVASGDTYNVYRDGNLVATNSANSTVDADTGLTPGTQYCYEVTAVSPNGGGTASSNQSCAATAALAGWKITTVEQAPPLSLALDASGGEHLSFCSPAGVVYETHGGNGGWNATLVDAGAACFNAPLAIGGDGSAHIIYVDANSNALKYASNASGRWTATAVPGGTGAEFYSLALDNGNHAHVAYLLFTGEASGYYQIVYATDASGSWQNTPVAEDMAYPQVAVDPQGRGAIAYVSGDVTGGTYPVHYLSDASGDWVDSVVGASGDSKSLAALALDATGHAYIAYKDQAQLKFVSDASGRWQAEIADSFDATGPYDDAAGAYDVSIDLDAGGGAHLSYQNADGDLKYVAATGGQWQTAYVDTEGAMSQIKMDGAGHAHIAYANEQNLYSKVAVSP